MEDRSGEGSSTLDWKIVGNVFVFYGSAGDFSALDFERWWNEVRAPVVRLCLGGAARGFRVSSSIRRHGRPLLASKNMPFATITNDRVVRGFATAGAWFGLPKAAFAWDALPRATAWLKLDAERSQEVIETLLALRESVENARAARATG